MPDTVIDVSALCYTYRGAPRRALDRTEFTVDRGEIFGFLGPNGAGKSTTQKILIGLLRDYEGEVQVLGRDLPDWSPDYYEHVGVAFEFPNHYLKLTGRENLTYFAALYRGDTLAPAEILERVDLAADADKPVGRYSKGMKRRLSVARALLNDPELVFLDEPTGGLDPVSGRRVKELLREQRDRGKTIFLTTHDMAVADELCDRVAFIVDGVIAAVDSPRRLKLRHGRRQVRVEVSDGEGSASEVFPLAGLGDDPGFLRLLREREVQTIHSLEATLEDVFVEVTGRSLT